MKTILNDSKDPRFNLALEEYVLKYLNSDEDFVLLWQNANSVIIGRNQNTYEEINASLVKEHDVSVVRRITGGGAVYHDMGNLNFSFITKTLKDNLNNYKKFTDPVIQALNALGVPAEFQGRNDIVVDGKKISGNAQAFHNNKMLHHGTILFDVNLAFVAEVLNVKQDKIASKGIKSNRARVTNIKSYLNNQSLDMTTFKETLLKNLLDTSNILDHVYALTDEDLNKIHELKRKRYDTWEWNYGESPESENVREKRYPGGKIEFMFNLKNGAFDSVRLFGDFLGAEDVSPIENALNGVLYQENTVRDALKELDIPTFFINITLEDVIDCLFY